MAPHGFAQFPFRQADLDCDYYAASAHKWLATPVGLGALWMRPQHVSKIWPVVPLAAARQSLAYMGLAAGTALQDGVPFANQPITLEGRFTPRGGVPFWPVALYRRELRRDFRQGEINRERFRQDRRELRRDFRRERRQDRRGPRRENRRDRRD